MGHMGFFTDTTLCIGCKACEVACKQWNQLPADGYKWTGKSYDNTQHLSATTWRHVAFVEHTRPSDSTGKVVNWLMMSDVCKHCEHAGCMEACPTGALIRNEFGDVYLQPDICNGCGYCVPSCPFGVVDLNLDDGRAFKCTLCYDRQKDGLEPACAKARSEEHTSELQSRQYLVCRLVLEKQNIRPACIPEGAGITSEPANGLVKFSPTTKTGPTVQTRNCAAPSLLGSDPDDLIATGTSGH